MNKKRYTLGAQISICSIELGTYLLDEWMSGISRVVLQPELQLKL